MGFFSSFRYAGACLFHWFLSIIDFFLSIFFISEQYDGEPENPNSSTSGQYHSEPENSSPSIHSQKNPNSSTSGEYHTEPENSSPLIHSQKNPSSSTSGQYHSERENAFIGVTPQASTSLPILSKRMPYDVFINHRGCDVKNSLASIIYHTLGLLNLRAFLDMEELELGDSIPVEIQEAMSSAKLHIAVFSVNYAQSPWCLAELSFMVNTRAPIIPVFYNVQPDHLRWVAQGKGMYASAFSQYEENGRYPSYVLHEWKTALQKVSNLSGYMLNSKTDDQGKLLKNIAQKVLGILKKVPSEVAEHQVTTPQHHHRESMASEVPHWNYVPMEMMGGKGGGPWDDGIYSGIRKIVVKFGSFIDSITFEYDLNGQSVWSERHGGSGGGEREEVEFDYPDEVLVSISGKFYSFNGVKIVTSITFHTNHKKKYGPFGNYGGDTFATPPVGCKIIGFYGRSGLYLDAIGVHLVMENPSGNSIRVQYHAI